MLFKMKKIRTYHLHGPLLVLPGVDGAPVRGPPQQAHEAVPEPLVFIKKNNFNGLFNQMTKS
jgi:hypothetical protein